MHASFLINVRQRKHFILAAYFEVNMPQKSKRKRQLENARAAKRMKVDGGEGSSTENQPWRSHLLTRMRSLNLKMMLTLILTVL